LSLLQENRSYSSDTVTIAIDAMGGDYGPESAVAGAALALKDIPSMRCVFFGDKNRIEPILMRHRNLKKVSSICHTDKVVRDDEKPSQALRASKGTSMRLAIEAVKEGEADAIVSAGNTGALMALSKLVLKTLPGIHRPAIASLFPAVGDSVIMLDLGANVLVDAENLVQFAVLGAVFARVHKGTQRPSVGLLNVGSEEMKGPDHVRSAASILSEIDFSGQYHGFVEGNDITRHTVDVVVSDGYAGNIALKAIEGVGSFSVHQFKKVWRADPLAMIGALFAYFGLKKFKRRVDPRHYNGGVFLGLNGISVKSHGGADALSFSSALRLAASMAQNNYISRVTDDINNLTSQETFLALGSYQE